MAGLFLGGSRVGLTADGEVLVDLVVFCCCGQLTKVVGMLIGVAVDLLGVRRCCICHVDGLFW